MLFQALAAGGGPEPLTHERFVCAISTSVGQSSELDSFVLSCFKSCFELKPQKALNKPEGADIFKIREPYHRKA